ncbi:MAG: iron-sulfur cluster assembly protein [Chloroflexota bacterium]
MALPTPEEVRSVIQDKVHDPELMLNIVDIGLIYGVEVTEEKNAEITMTLTSPGCPAGPQIIGDVQRETHTAFPDLEEVNVHLVWTPFWNPEMMSDDAKDELGIF